MRSNLLDTDLILGRAFFEQKATQVANSLIGQRIVRLLDGSRISGIILETEAYDGEQDLACHARSGRTHRNAVMYGPPGHAYVYFTYGMHWLLNCVTGKEGYPAAVLIRAILPVEGLDIITKRRKGIPQKHWCDGPAKLTKALSIDGGLNGANLCTHKNGLFIEQGITIPAEWLQCTARIGIRYAPQPWRTKPWRFVATLPKYWQP